MSGRDYAKIHVGIAEDDHLESLSTDAQWLYFRVLLPDPSLNHCGVADWRPRRLTVKSRDMTLERIHAAAQELDAENFALFDEETEEVLVRSYIRNDRVLRNPNVSLALVKAYRLIASKRLKSAILTEIARERRDHPEYTPWHNERTADDLQRLADQGDKITNSEGSCEGSSQGSCEGSSQGSDTAKPNKLTPSTYTPNTYHLAPSTCTPDTSASGKPSEPSSRKRSSETAKHAEEFERFWTLYPRKESKKKAFEKFVIARRSVDLDVLLSSVERYVEHIRQTRTEPRFIKIPTTWLNQGCWDDVYETAESIKPKSGQSLLQDRIIQRHSGMREIESK